MTKKLTIFGRLIDESHTWRGHNIASSHNRIIIQPTLYGLDRKIFADITILSIKLQPDWE